MSSLPSTEEAMKPLANERDMKLDAIADGYIVKSTIKTSLGDRLSARVNRTIAGKNVECTSMATKPEMLQAVVDACKSIAVK